SSPQSGLPGELHLAREIEEECQARALRFDAAADSFRKAFERLHGHAQPASPPSIGPDRYDSSIQQNHRRKPPRALVDSLVMGGPHDLARVSVSQHVRIEAGQKTDHVI